MLGTIIIVILILFLIGGISPMGRGNYWGAGPVIGGGLPTILIIIVIVLLLTGRI